MKADSDSGHSPSDDEKKVGVEAGAFESLATHQLPPDPDAGLSDEEKARIVGFLIIREAISLQVDRTGNSSSSWTSASFPGYVSST